MPVILGEELPERRGRYRQLGFVAGRSGPHGTMLTSCEGDLKTNPSGWSQ
jgi:hypothetical protein